MCRNSRGCSELFVHESHDVSSMLYGLYEDHPDASTDQSIPLNPSLTNGMSGIIKLDDKMQQHLKTGFIEPPFQQLRLIKDNRAVSCQYRDPYFPSNFIFEATLLPGAEIGPRTLKPENYGKGDYFPVLGFKARERQHPYSTPPSAKRTIQHSLSDPTHHYNQQQRNPGYGNPRNQYQQGYNNAYASPHQRQTPSRMQWEPIPQPPSRPPWSGGRDQRQQQQDARHYHGYNSYPSTPQHQSPSQYQPYQQQQYQPYQQQQQQWKGQHNSHPVRTPNWSRHQ